MFNIFNLKTNKTIENFDPLSSKVQDISSIKIAENNAENDYKL